MVAVDIMDASENLEVDVEENDEVVNNKQNATIKQVIIYHGGKALLKVETGTTLEVMKLLYEAECDSTCTNVIGVRPRVTTGIPCIITLKDSQLEEAAYDLIVREKKPASPMSPTNIDRNGHCVMARCMDCSRESWKSKRYTSVGMNTEISINPLLEMDSLRSVPVPSNYPSNHPPVVSESTYPARSRGRPPNVQRPLPVAPHHGGIVYSNLHKKDYVLATLPAIPINNGVPSHDMEYMDRCHYRARSPQRSPPGRRMHSGGRTQISYPPPMSKAIDLDSVPYEGLHAIRRPASHSPNHGIKAEAVGVKADSGHLSPRRPRSRSPVIPHKGYMKKESVEVYYPRITEERRPRYSRTPPQFPKYEAPVSVPAVPAQNAEHTTDGEPPVYVLPNDFDLHRDRIEPHIISYSQSKTYTENGTSPNSQKQSRPSAAPGRTSPQTSESSSKSTEETPEVPVEQRTLSCKICKQTFPTKSTLYKHLRGHSSDEKPFKCNECGQGFTLSSNLRQHRIIHRGYKPFQCEYCGKKFMRSNVYKQHRRIHTGEQMHKCEWCPSEFLQKYALVKHLKKIHNIEAVEN